MTHRPYVRALFEDPMLVGFEINGAVYSPQDVKILFADNRRANPETCLHNVVQPAMGSYTEEQFVICVSCDSTLSAIFFVDRTYEYDIDHNVWVYVPKKRGVTIVNTPPTPGRGA